MQWGHHEWPHCIVIECTLCHRSAGCFHGIFPSSYIVQVILCHQQVIGSHYTDCLVTIDAHLISPIMPWAELLSCAMK